MLCASCSGGSGKHSAATTTTGSATNDSGVSVVVAGSRNLARLSGTRNSGHISEPGCRRTGFRSTSVTPACGTRPIGRWCSVPVPERRPGGSSRTPRTTSPAPRRPRSSVWRRPRAHRPPQRRPARSTATTCIPDLSAATSCRNCGSQSPYADQAVSASSKRLHHRAVPSHRAIRERHPRPGARSHRRALRSRSRLPGQPPQSRPSACSRTARSCFLQRRRLALSGPPSCPGGSDSYSPPPDGGLEVARIEAIPAHPPDPSDPSIADIWATWYTLHLEIVVRVDHAHEVRMQLGVERDGRVAAEIINSIHTARSNH